MEEISNVGDRRFASGSTFSLTSCKSTESIFVIGCLEERTLFIGSLSQYTVVIGSLVKGTAVAGSLEGGTVASKISAAIGSFKESPRGL